MATPSPNNNEAAAGEMLAAALSNVERGWHVFPVDGKLPRTPRGFKDATLERDQVETWWGLWPTAGVAVATGRASGLVVVDLDGEDGADAWHELEQRHGELPPTVEVLTGRGRHIYFQHPGTEVRNSAGKLGAGIDVRADGGYVVSPPSPHPSGDSYVYEVSAEPGDVELAEMPDWLRALLTEKPRTNGSAPVADAIPEGRRNTTLTSLAGTMRRRGMEAAAIAAALKVENEKCAPPLPEDEVERIVDSVAGYAPAEESPAKKSQATKLVEMAGEDELFHHDQTGYARFAVEGHYEVSTLRTRGYRGRLARRFFEREASTPSAQALQDALAVLEGRALYDGKEHPVATRIAEHEGAIYLDLANPDWDAVEITRDGWRIVSDPPVRFRRPKGMGELPRPHAGDLTPLWRLVNLEPVDRPLFAAWLLAALRPSGPYPVLALHGEQGSAKSSTARMAKLLVDPNTAPLRAAPKSGHDLMIAATNGWIVALDNLSSIQPWLSDALCRLATGGGFATRTLYENDEEQIFDAQRPVLLNGIGEVATRGDLVDRAIVLESPRIADDHRLAEAVLWRNFAAAQPQILGALLDAVVRGLNELDGVELTNPPRMADFAEWAVATSPAVGFPADTFIGAYATNRDQGSSAVLENAPIATALLDVADSGFRGTTTELLERLGKVASESDMRSKEWPRSAAALGKLLTRPAPNLRDAGFEVEAVRESGGRRRKVLRIEKSPAAPVRLVQPVRMAQTSQETRTSNGRDGRDGRATDEDRTSNAENSSSVDKPRNQADCDPPDEQRTRRTSNAGGYSGPTLEDAILAGELTTDEDAS